MGALLLVLLPWKNTSLNLGGAELLKEHRGEVCNCLAVEVKYLSPESMVPPFSVYRDMRKRKKNEA